jgi:chemotaxis protein MotB
MDSHFSDLEIKVMKEPQSSVWLTSLADLLALMLAFFVLLFAMNEIKIVAWKEILETLGQKYDPKATEISDGAQKDKNMALIDEHKAINLDYLENVYLEQIAKNENLKGIDISKVGNKLVVSLPADNFFLPGSDAKSQIASEALQLLSNSLINIKNRVEIYGHTDPDPITSETGKFRTNWELSLARAIVIAQELRSLGYSGSIRSFGFAASRFHEIDSQLPLAEKFSIARRVDIIIRDAADTGWK